MKFITFDDKSTRAERWEEDKGTAIREVFKLWNENLIEIKKVVLKNENMAIPSGIPTKGAIESDAKGRGLDPFGIKSREAIENNPW